MTNRKEYHRKYARKYYWKNRDKCVQYIRLWRKHNPIKNWAGRSLSRHKEWGYNVKVNRDYLEELRRNTKNCCYCNCKLKSGKKKLWAKSPTLDVIDGSKNVTVGNIQVICHRCNMTKQNRTHEQFVDYCSNIVNKFPTRKK